MFFFFNDAAPTEIYPLPLHDPLPICSSGRTASSRSGTDAVGASTGRTAADGHTRSAAETERDRRSCPARLPGGAAERRDRKSTRLNSSHANISYAVFCLKKKKKITRL